MSPLGPPISLPALAALLATTVRRLEGKAGLKPTGHRCPNATPTHRACAMFAQGVLPSKSVHGRERRAYHSQSGYVSRIRFLVWGQSLSLCVRPLYEPTSRPGPMLGRSKRSHQPMESAKALSQGDDTGVRFRICSRPQGSSWPYRFLALLVLFFQYHWIEISEKAHDLPLAIRKLPLIMRETPKILPQVLEIH